MVDNSLKRVNKLESERRKSGLKKASVWIVKNCPKADEALKRATARINKKYGKGEV